MNSGVKQWVFQRISNALFVTFGICLLCIFLGNDGLTYEYITAELISWKWYFVVLLVLAFLNAILAGWQIDGDYAKKFGIPSMVITVLTALVSLIFLIYGFKLLL
jgi:succinate dehydrogenase hydrophobic anchor subunit